MWIGSSLYIVAWAANFVCDHSLIKYYFLLNCSSQLIPAYLVVGYRWYSIKKYTW